MKLIKVETKGFKSFANKITLNFDGGIVGIVGPNGSGKSNINDAIKWVLGEQSLKNLRGDSTDDIIFSGSKKVQSLNKAEVFLTFDNSEGKCSIPHKKIIISRHVERGISSNKYFINGKVAKLKEIKEIAMESGIGKSSLAIISQGTIQNIAQAKPEERRLFFEEAAGISKYKQRKKEAMNKLEKTSETLEKISIIVKELEKQLKPLKKQSEKANLYLLKKKELKKIELELISDDIVYFSKKLKELDKNLENTFSYKEELKEKISNYEKKLHDKNSQKLLFENEIISLNNNLQNTSEKLRDLQILNSQISERRKLIIEGKINSSSKLKIKTINEELQELWKKIIYYKNFEKKSLEEINNKKKNISIQENKLNDLNYLVEKNEKKLIQFLTKIDILKNQKNSKSYLFKGVKTIIENSSLFKGFLGLVMNLIKVEEDYRISIETILSNVFQHIVVSNSSEAVKCVQFLNKNKAGRATFIPLNRIKPKFIKQELLAIIKSQDGYVGIAKNLVKTKEKYNILKEFLLGNIVVVDNIENANKISKLINNLLMIVTLNGDVIRSSGIISGGEKLRTKNLLWIDEEIQKMEKFIPNLSEKIKQQKSENQILLNLISKERTIISELNIEIVKTIEKRNVLQVQFNNLKSQFEFETNKKFKANNNKKISTENFEVQKSSIQTKIKLKRESIIDFNKEIVNLNNLKTDNEKKLRNLIENSTSKVNEKNQAEFIINNQKERLMSEYGITVENVINQYSLSIEKKKAQEIVAKLKNQIKEIGNINLDSIEKYKEIKERYFKIYNSEKELMEAKDIIVSAIHNMDKIIVNKLDETVKNVNNEMINIFKTMFGGGMAEVKYTDPKNILISGIEIIAQPPGKTVKNLKLFSGGEKSIIAITLLFAILKYKPIPLCILDEVEAALDEANVLRFASYLQQLKKQTQFIVVTHRIGTMSKVDHLFGATMQTRGVTSFFTVKLSDAKKMIE